MNVFGRLTSPRNRSPRDERTKDKSPSSANSTPRSPNLTVPLGSSHGSSPGASPSSSPLPSPRVGEIAPSNPRKQSLSASAAPAAASPSKKDGKGGAAAPPHSDSATSMSSVQSSTSSLSSSARSATETPLERSLVEWSRMVSSARYNKPLAESDRTASAPPPPVDFTKLSPQALVDIANSLVVQVGDTPETASLYRMAAEKGHLDAQAILASILVTGKGDVTKDVKEGLEWYRRAVVGGQADAQCNLGLLLLDGVKPELAADPPEGVRLLRCSADQGNSAAAFALGMCFATKKGVEKDYLSAIQWFNRAAEKDHAEAIYWLGMMFEKGKGYKKSNSEAVKCYQRSHKLGYKHAETRLLRLLGKLKV